MNPTSVQHAALRVLLDDIDPLLQQAASTAEVLKTVQAELRGDLEVLVKLVQRSVDAQPALLETGHRLGAAAARIEATLLAPAVASGTSRSAETTAERRWPACVLAALLSTALLLAGTWVGTRELREQARLGRALQAAWPLLDAATRARVRDGLDRS